MEKLELKLVGTDDYFTQEAYKVLRSNIQFCGQDIKVIMLTSCHANEGKSTLSLHLGKNFADLGKRVLIIDADMRKSVMAGRNTNAKSPKGLSEVLTGLAELEECIYPTQYENLNLLFAGKYPPNPVELLSSKHFAGLIATAREMFDYVIIDTPPLGMVIDAAVVAPQCDGTAIVFSQKVKYSQAKNVIEQLQKSNSKILGVIRNKVGGGRKKGYYYSNKYKYRYAYK